MARLVGLTRVGANHEDDLTRKSTTDLLGVGSVWVDAETGNWFMWSKNVSGGALADGDIVTVDLTDDTVGHVTGTSGTDQLVGAGVSQSAPSDDEFFFVLVRGKDTAKTDGSGVNIAAGDALGTIASNKLAKTTTANAQVAYALDAQAADGTSEVYIINKM